MLVNSTYWQEADEVAAFEELVGSHGGMGGGQSLPFVLFPAELDWPDEPVIGAEDGAPDLPGLARGPRARGLRIDGRGLRWPEHAHLDLRGDGSHLSCEFRPWSAEPVAAPREKPVERSPMNRDRNARPKQRGRLGGPRRVEVSRAERRAQPATGRSATSSGARRAISGNRSVSPAKYTEGRAPITKPSGSAWWPRSDKRAGEWTARTASRERRGSRSAAPAPAPQPRVRLGAAAGPPPGARRPAAGR